MPLSRTKPGWHTHASCRPRPLVHSREAQAYVTPRNIQQWLLAGASPRTLALEIGALLLHPKVDAGRLDDMRALLHRHKELLQDTAKWPVPHVVEQLAAQDLGASVQQEATDGSGEGMCRLIECITPSLVSVTVIALVAFA